MSMIVPHVVWMLLVVQMTSGLVCKRLHCYGKMDEMENVRASKETVTFHVQPCNSNPSCSENECLDKLSKSVKLDCNGNTTSLLTSHHPWVVPTGLSLQPSCTELQSLVRQSQPSEQVEHMDGLAIAKVVIDEKQTPCAVIKLSNSNVALSNLEIDNELCVSSMVGNQSPYYASSVMNIYPSKRYISNITIESVKTRGGGVSLHIASLSKRFPVLNVSNITLRNITGGSIHVEMICGDVHIEGCHIFHQDTPVPFCQKDSMLSLNITRISPMMGPLQSVLLYQSLTTGSHPSGNCVKCYIVLSMALLFSILLVATSCICFFSNHLVSSDMLEPDLLAHGLPLNEVVSKKRGKLFLKRHDA